MKERLEERLRELKDEFGRGEQTLAELEAQTATVRQNLLRISGAIQVLEELRDTSEPQEGDSGLSADEARPTDGSLDREPARARRAE